MENPESGALGGLAKAVGQRRYNCCCLCIAAGMACLECLPEQFRMWRADGKLGKQLRCPVCISGDPPSLLVGMAVATVRHVPAIAIGGFLQGTSKCSSNATVVRLVARSRHHGV